MPLDAIRSLIAEDFEAVDGEIRSQLDSDIVLINQLGHYIVAGGGKRLRPLLVLLAARALDYDGRDHIPMAAMIEFIHTATLLHDDVVDASEMRRGRDTANARWGNEAAVLVGDFLYSRAFQMMVGADRMRIMEVMAGATNRIAEGEVLQLLNCNDPDTTEARYLDVIERKTATLFAAGTRVAAILARADAETEDALAEYGRALGTAFQIIDDVLDYRADDQRTGKNLGDDLAEGKPTLPLIHAMGAGRAEQQAAIREGIEQGGRERLDEVLTAIHETGALEYAAAQARQAAENAEAALAPLPDNDYTRALRRLARFSVERDH